MRNTTANIEKHPVVLPEHHVTRLIIRDIHTRNGHAGSNHTMSVLRRKYFLLCGYKQIRNVLKSCVECRKHHGQPMQQLMADLPKERVEVYQPPFTSVGVDLFWSVKRQISSRYNQALWLFIHMSSDESGTYRDCTFTGF